MGPFRHGLIAKLGAASGVVALLALVLLAPIHHIHAIAFSFTKAGHALHDGQLSHDRSASNPGEHTPDEPGRPPVRCPFCMAAKSASVLLPLVGPAIAVRFAAIGSVAPVPAASPTPLRFVPAARPRAPPAQT
jgi:hypothetical protein